MRRRLLALVAVALLASLLAACTVSLAGGLAGMGLSALLALLLVVTAGATQSGCDTEPTSGVVTDALPDGADVAGGEIPIGPCLTAPYDAHAEPEPDAAADMHVGPCLSVMPDSVGPCLGAPYDGYVEPGPDAVEDIGPCLSPPYDAWIEPDAVGPCLSIEPDAVGPCLSPPEDVWIEPDAVGPCLSIEPPDAIGPCLSPPYDAGSEADGDADGSTLEIPIGPCLSYREGDPPEDDHAGIEPANAPGPTASAAAAAGAEPRAALLERFAARGALPADVIARLLARAGGDPPDRT